MTSLSSPDALKRLGALLVLIVLIAITFDCLIPNYFSASNVHALMRHMSVQGVTALGLTFVIIVSHFDLSFPGVASLGAMTLGWLIASEYTLSVCVAGGLAVGFVAGLVNGVAITKLRLPDIVVTIATGGIAVGLSYLYSGGTSISENFFSSGLLDLNDAKLLFLDAPFVVLMAAAAAAYMVLHGSRFGRSFYATGENPISAAFSGIRTQAYVTVAFALCSLLACLAILLLVASSGASNVTTGNQLLMPAFAAVYLGAALFGRPSVLATLAGTLLMSMMLDGFTLLAVPYYYSDAIVSIVLISAVSAFNPRLLEAIRKFGTLRSIARRRALS